MRRQTHLMLLALTIGSLWMSAHGGETSSDYENDYDEDDPARAPGNLAKSTAAPVVPYFNQKTAVVHVDANASNVKIDCPVKNYDAKHHVILWYRDETLVMNGVQPVIDIYKLDSQFVLDVPLANATGHIFHCEVQPSGVRRAITVKLGPTPASPQPNSTPASASAAPALSWSTAVKCLLLSALILAQF
ncbi:uncharacterized protein LOC111595262 [Drosophila hydei]|uniref:Uncharacterized protein LOC111595262 n=1 Tax=Drosophila hydei TaxID=7224 RepID=A0A6J1LCQ6_DROHY|nr:uncharacterized protein LOC111595262 [Drosophila hydei]